jgi:hypothetical protein
VPGKMELNNKLFRDLPRELLSNIIIFSSQMRIVEYYKKLKKDFKNFKCSCKEDIVEIDNLQYLRGYEGINDLDIVSFCKDYYLSIKEKIIALEIIYFRKPRVIKLDYFTISIVKKYFKDAITDIKSLLDHPDSAYLYKWLYVVDGIAEAAVVTNECERYIEEEHYYYRAFVIELVLIIDLYSIEPIIKEMVARRSYIISHNDKAINDNINLLYIEYTDLELDEDEEEYLMYLIRTYNKVYY